MWFCKTDFYIGYVGAFLTLKLPALPYLNVLLKPSMFYNSLSCPAVHVAFLEYKWLGFPNYQMQMVLTIALSVIVSSLSCTGTTEAFLGPRVLGNYAW